MDYYGKNDIGLRRIYQELEQYKELHNINPNLPREKIVGLFVRDRIRVYNERISELERKLENKKKSSTH